MRYATITAVVVAAVALGAPGTASASRSCAPVVDEGITPTNIHAVGTPCRVARRVATRVAKVPSFGGCTDARRADGRSQLFIRQPCKRFGYRCRDGRDLGEGVRVKCSRGAKRIRFDLRV
jgi:hypothetical protein